MSIQRARKPTPLNLLARQDEEIEDPEESPDTPDTPDTPTPSSYTSEPAFTSEPTAIESFSGPPAPTETGTFEFLPDSQDGSLGRGMEGNQELSSVAKGLLATFAILGGLSMIVIFFICFRRRRGKKTAPSKKRNFRTLLPSLSRKRKEHPPATPSSPSLEDLITRPETAHVPTYRITRATNKSTSWKIQSYDRSPEFAPHEKSNGEHVTSVAGNTLVDGSERGSVNPFEDPQLKKSYDMIHNRPRSTTLTETGEWLKNPFEDPRDERFDPFGTLRERAKEERKKYIALLKTERKKHEQNRAVPAADIASGSKSQAVAPGR